MLYVLELFRKSVATTLSTSLSHLSFHKQGKRNLSSVGMSTALFLIVDNRRYPFQDFETEALYASYHSHLLNLIGKLQVLNANHSWMPRIYMIIAESPTQTKLLDKWELSNLPSLLECKFTCPASNSIPNETWGGYLRDALSKIRSNLRWQSQKPDRVTIVVYSNDLSLIGKSNSSPSLSEGVNNFCSDLYEMTTQQNGINVRIVCSKLSSNQSFLLSFTPEMNHCSENLITIHRMLQLMPYAKIGLSSIVNTSPHYEEELRMVLILCAPSIIIKVDFSVVDESNATLHIELLPGNFDAAEVMNQGILTPVLHCLIPRGCIDPLFLTGKSMLAHCPPFNYRTKGDPYITEERLVVVCYIPHRWLIFLLH